MNQNVIERKAKSASYSVCNIEVEGKKYSNKKDQYPEENASGPGGKHNYLGDERCAYLPG